MVQTAQSYPALIPLIAAAVGLALWSYRRHRYALATLSVLLGSALVLLYTGGTPATALSPAGALEPAAVAHGGQTLPAVSRARPHPRFPADFPIPASFRSESSSGGAPGGALSVRFRFRGEGAEAVRALKTLGEANGWNVEQLAPHRLVLRKDNRTVEAWFSYPAHSVVLDIAEGR